MQKCLYTVEFKVRSSGVSGCSNEGDGRIVVGLIFLSEYGVYSYNATANLPKLYFPAKETIA